MANLKTFKQIWYLPFNTYKYLSTFLIVLFGLKTRDLRDTNLLSYRYMLLITL